MHFCKKKEEESMNNEFMKMIEAIKMDKINNVCFECGVNNPEYISINNAIFLCQECIQGHNNFPKEISLIINNDFYSLNYNEIKKLYLGGNKKLIQFINFEFPSLKQFPPNILYKTRAVDYYRKNLDFLVNGEIKPLKPNFETAYQLLNIQNENNNTNYKNDLYLSPKICNNEKIMNSTQLTPISEGNQLDDENNLSSLSEDKNEKKKEDEDKNESEDRKENEETNENKEKKENEETNEN